MRWRYAAVPDQVVALFPAVGFAAVECRENGQRLLSCLPVVTGSLQQFIEMRGQLGPRIGSRRTVAGIDALVPCRREDTSEAAISDEVAFRDELQSARRSGQ